MLDSGSLLLPGGSLLDSVEDTSLLLVPPDDESLADALPLDEPLDESDEDPDDQLDDELADPLDELEQQSQQQQPAWWLSNQGPVVFDKHPSKFSVTTRV